MKHKNANLNQRVIVTEAKGWTLLEVGDVGIITEFSSWDTTPIARVTVEGKRDTGNWLPTEYMEPYPKRNIFQKLWDLL